MLIAQPSECREYSPEKSREEDREETILVGLSVPGESTDAVPPHCHREPGMGVRTGARLKKFIRRLVAIALQGYPPYAVQVNPHR
jgi:hypothetical protein